MNTQTPPETNERPTPPSRSCSIEIERFLQHARSGVALPFPGYGKTARRFDSLRAESANDASVGRLIEAHKMHSPYLTKRLSPHRQVEHSQFGLRDHWRVCASPEPEM